MTVPAITRSTLLLASWALLLGPLWVHAQDVRRESRGREDTPATAAPPPEVTVLQSDARTLVFEYRPRFGPTRTIKTQEGEFVSVDLEGGIPLFRSNQPGQPDVRYRNIAVALPGDAGNAVRIVSADVEEIRGVSLAPVPTSRWRDGLLESARLEKDAAAYGSAEFLPARAVELGGFGRMRSILVGDVRLFPLQYSPGTRTLRKYSRMVVEVSFGPFAGPRIEPEDQRLVGTALVNGEAARAWAGPAVRKTGAALTPSVLASGTWYKMTVTEEGIYKLDAQYLTAAGISLTGLDPRNIKIYGNGGREVPEDPTQPRPQDLVELAIYVEGEADGGFGPSDYILFYGRGTRGWQYDPAGKTLRHFINRYTEENYYWLTVDGPAGRRMASRPSETSAATITQETFQEGVFIEEEKVNLLRSGKDWYGQTITGPSGSFTHVSSLPGLLSGQTILYRYTLLSGSEAPGTFTVREGTTTIGVHTLPRAFSYIVATAGTFQATGTSSLNGAQSQLSFTYNSPTLSSQGVIDWIEIIYPRMLWGVSEYLRFRSPDAGGVVEYQLQQFAAMPLLFDVTRHDSVAIISGMAGSYSFRVRETAGRVSEYCAAGNNSWKLPTAVRKMTNQNLRGYAEGADFIILTHQQLLSAANRLKTFREQPSNGGLKTVVVDVDQIYNEFSGGLPDVTAIRDYLKYAYENWTPRPQYVLFFGQASYDYKGILGARSSYVPTWQSAESRDDVDSYATDDFYVKFGLSDRPSLVLGRISSRTPSEGEIAVDKIIRYETSSVRDNWKMRMLYIGDDAWTPEGGDVGDRTLHSDDAEVLANPFYTPDEFEKKKIYIAEYPTVNSAQGRRKPGAYQAIIDQVNQGVLMLNYSGHGNPNVWAHERVFEVGSSIPQLVNQDRLAVFFLATCNFSQYDDPKSTTGAEVLMNRVEGGAIGVVSASRKVYAGANAALNQGTYRRLFTRDAFGRVVVERPATALFLYKTASGNFENDQKFFYMGDPTMHLQYPRRYASIDSINGQPVPSGGGAIMLRSLSRVTVSGTVRNAANQFDSTYAGKATLIVNDASQTQTIVNFYPGANWQYTATGGTIYRGENSVANGRFIATFVVPKDISYADTTLTGRLTAYVSSVENDGAGYTGAVRVGGTDTSAAPDKTGPSVAIYLENRSFRSGDVVKETPVLLVDLADSNGINTSGSGIGHRIEALINNSTQSLDLTEFYTSSLDNFREGTIRYQLKRLPQGKNVILVRAWDSYNNSSVGEVFFDVASGDRLAIADVFNYPNPFATTTEFTFRHNYAGTVSATVKIYTVAGRLIQTLEGTFTNDLFVRIPWDARDRDGDLVANGVYLYKVLLSTADGQMSAESLGKLSVIR